MKIAFLTRDLNTTDGGGRFSNDLVENLKKDDVQVTTITIGNKGLLLNFFKIRKIFKNSDIIHAIDVWPNGFYARIISFGLKKPIIITALGTYSVAPFYSQRRFLMEWVCNGARLIAISDYTKKEILEIMPNLNIKVIYPGFDLNFWCKETTVSEEILRLKPYILSVGALKLRKGYHNSIGAFAIVAKKTENLNHVIIGQGEKSNYAKELKSIVRENKLENRVFFVSSGIDDNELLGFYINAELFILTPVEENHHFEGFGIVYLEAAASGLPIVASQDSGAASAVRDGYNGILTPQNNPEATAKVILKILENPELKTRLANNSREWVKNFKWGRIIKDYINIYNGEINHN